MSWHVCFRPLHGCNGSWPLYIPTHLSLSVIDIHVAFMLAAPNASRKKKRSTTKLVRGYQRSGHGPGDTVRRDSRTAPHCMSLLLVPFQCTSTPNLYWNRWESRAGIRAKSVRQVSMRHLDTDTNNCTTSRAAASIAHSPGNGVSHDSPLHRSG